jgi:hypothetical protein
MMRREIFWPFRPGDRASICGRNVTILSIAADGVATCQARKVRGSKLEKHTVEQLSLPLKRGAAACNGVPAQIEQSQPPARARRVKSFSNQSTLPLIIRSIPQFEAAIAEILSLVGFTKGTLAAARYEHLVAAADIWICSAAPRKPVLKAKTGS